MPADPSARAIGELALVLHAAPGRFALLLGSSISASSGILTGWNVVKDLIGKLAVATGADDVADPIAWYPQTYQGDPDYSRLIDEMARPAG